MGSGHDDRHDREGRFAASYVRKSSVDERSTDDGRSIERQREQCAAFARPGTGGRTLVAAINERRAEVEALKAIPSVSEPPPFDRAAFFRRFAGVRAIAMLLKSSYPERTRQVLRKLGVTRIVVHPDPVESGWLFEGAAKLAGHVLGDGDGHRHAVDSRSTAKPGTTIP
jgi:hypothetical protein